MATASVERAPGRCASRHRVQRRYAATPVTFPVTFALTVGAFLLGSVPTGLWLAARRRVDLRAVGSGNIGATNVARGLGKKWAAVVLVLDAAKGFTPVAVGHALGLPPWSLAVVAWAAPLGHCFSIFLRGRGGKGVATSLGAAIALEPLSAALAAVIYGVAFAIWRISSLGSLLAAGAFPLLVLWQGRGGMASLAFALAAVGLILMRHKANLRRLVRGEETRL